jgi:ribosomal protein RSM22 (predicted rRNA methylase)
MRTSAQVVQRTVVADRWWPSSLAEIAPRLPEVLQDCDRLTFDTDAEVRAYAALHLVDRYGRVLQVLEYLFTIGRLPLRHGGIAALEVGAGPAPRYTQSTTSMSI